MNADTYEKLIGDLEKEKSEIKSELNCIMDRRTKLVKRMMEIRLAIYEMERM